MLGDEKMHVLVKRLTDTAIIPTKTNISDAGFDLYADESTWLYAGNSGKRKIIKTGVSFAIPEGYVGLVWDRSGMGAKLGIHRFAGVIDAGYRGEIMVALCNFGSKPYAISRGDRIAKILIQAIPNVSLIEVDELPNSERGKGGFGSSGK